MRSLLIQASTVEKAVEKAWSSAGMPTEFTIKILEFGEKGFFGITKKPAIVSIVYEPQRQTAVSKSQQEYTKKKSAKKTAPKRMKKQSFAKKEAVKKEATKPPKERIFWSDAMTEDVTGWLKQVSKIIGITTPIKSQVNKKALMLTFDGYALGGPEEERLLFSSLASILMQFMKKKYKKKYQGYHIIITSKRFDKK